MTMTNTIPNVPRDWFDRVHALLYKVAYENTPEGLEAECLGSFIPSILSAPSPAGVDADHIEDVRAMVKAQGVALDGSQLAGLLEQVRLNDDEAKPHGNGATYWNNAVVACQVAIRDALSAPVQQVGVPEGSTKMQWPEIVALVNEVLGCEAHKYPCERGSIGHEMTGINFNSLARIIDRVHRLAAAPAAPAADAGMVEALDYQVLFDAIAAATSVYANGAVNISVQAFRDALAAHRAQGVV